MEKEQDQNQEDKQDQKSEELRDFNQETLKAKDKEIEEKEKKKEQKELSPEEIIIELEDRLTRTFAEMENQRRRFEKEKEDAFDYGGFTFAKEALNLIDNLERSKQILENDESLKNSKVLEKTLEHLDIIYKDVISIFFKNNIKPIESLNKKLDPNLHQAMLEIEDDQKRGWNYSSGSSKKVLPSKIGY